MIHPRRLQYLNDGDVRDGEYVLYWMQQAQRSECNHALEYAIREADALRLPLVVAFGIAQRYPEANIRHYAFMLEGLSETRRALEARGIRFVVRLSPPSRLAAELGRAAALVVTDRGYLRVQRQWRCELAAKLRCRLVEVDTDAVVPLEVASPKEEYAARTLRPKIRDLLPEFMHPLEESSPKRDSLDLSIPSLSAAELKDLPDTLRVNRNVPAVGSMIGGTQHAKARLRAFLSGSLRRYAAERSDPGTQYTSRLSAYLHFGQISPLYVALQAGRARDAGAENVAAFLEELIVRRELSLNFCWHNPAYDRFECLPDWARRALQEHRGDPRPTAYDAQALERAQTHDPFWNAAQNELLHTGEMHNYMRMYWGKKILEWSVDPENAFDIAVHLNNKYALDGRDANSYAGVAWCFGKHDRPWSGRPIFGTVRYMSQAGLTRKFDMEAYVRRVEGVTRAIRG